MKLWRMSLVSTDHSLHVLVAIYPFVLRRSVIAESGAAGNPQRAHHRRDLAAHVGKAGERAYACARCIPEAVPPVVPAAAGCSDLQKKCNCPELPGFTRHNRADYADVLSSPPAS